MRVIQHSVETLYWMRKINCVYKNHFLVSIFIKLVLSTTAHKTPAVGRGASVYT